MTIICSHSLLGVITLIVIALASSTMAQGHKTRHQVRDSKPNIVIIMTDDQDIELGSMKYMPKTLRILQQGGAKFTNSFTNSPICCPSRSSFLTGLHVHNHNVWTNNVNCSSPYWQENFEVNSFATYLQNAGYRTGYFGKYLNEYLGEHIPAGWTEWLGLVKNSAFYNYRVNHNGEIIRHGNDYAKDYFTDLIANDSVAFFKSSKLNHPNTPVAMVLSMPAPHGPEDSAPQFSHMFTNITDHRTPNWNYAPNPDKQFLLQITGKMEPIQSEFADLLMRKRVMTLQSVDDAVEKVYNELTELGELDNTYMMYISDHGYHLGQFGLPKGKSLPYEFDVRIPLYVRGPGVKPGSRIKQLVGMVDIAPTLLDMAGVVPPEHMDGKSVVPLLDNTSKSGKVKAWRDTFLIERGKIRRHFLENDDMENFLPIYFTKEGNIDDKCNKPKYQYPCKADQKYYCYKDSLDRRRIRKCNKLTEKCACKEFKRNKRETDSVSSQKCSVVDGTVHCTRVEGSENSGKVRKSSFNNRRKALDQLIRDYRQQLEKLKGLRKDLELDEDNINMDKYQLPDTTSERTSSAVGRDSSVKPRASASSSKRRRNLDCFCAKEGQINDHDLDPKDLVMDKEERQELALAFGDEDSLSKRERKRLERQKKRDEKKLGRQEDKSKQIQRKKKDKPIGKRNNPYCQVDGVECTVMDNDHWKTEPKWTLGPFCFCNNAQSNVFWCLRVMNETDNFLYCEFVNDFLSFYDLNEDPWQLRNVIHDISYPRLGQLHDLLLRMRECQGFRKCTYRYKDRDSLSSDQSNG